MLEIKNFLDNPELIRQIGLQLNYRKCDFFQQNGIWSGFRADVPYELIYNEIKQKIEYHTNEKIKRLSTVFHINPEVSCLGAPHFDSKEEKGFAGVIYLNQNLPNDLSYGTTLYESPKNEYEMSIHDIQIMYSVDLPSCNKHKMSMKQRFIDYKNSLIIKQKIKNEYNKIILYHSNIYHAPDYYFGDSIDNSRMTIAIHGDFE